MSMFLEKLKPVYALENETGTGAGETPDGGSPPPEAPPEPEADESHDAGLGRSKLRKQLEKGFEDGRKAEAAAAKPAKQKSRAREAIEAEAPEPEAEAPEAEAAAPAIAAPESLSKEAKAAWAKAPPEIQAAFIKREQDMAKGVEELKGRYADIDRAIAPHMDAIRRHGHSPAAAVNQLFGWFQALGASPDQAFPALAKSFNWDINKLAAAGAAEVAGKEQQPPGEIPPALQTYITQLESRVQELGNKFDNEIGGLKSNFQQQSEAKTNEILGNWARDKVHFDAVRPLMAQFIASGAVPLKDGQVDLDGAYQMAIYANPEVRTKVLAEAKAAEEKAAKDKKAAELKAQQDQAAKARRAGVSLTGGAPSDGSAGPGKAKVKGKSVRESIMEAREELSS